MICWVAKGRVNKIIPNTKKLKVIFTSWHYRVDAQTQRRQTIPEPFLSLPPSLTGGAHVLSLFLIFLL